MFSLNFEHVKEKKEFEPLPKGDYPFAVGEMSVENAKSGNGRFLKAELEVTEGPFEGRKMFPRFNFEHTNPKTVEIALEQMLNFFDSIYGKGSAKEAGNLNLDHFLSCQGKRLVGAVGPDKSGDSEIKFFKEYKAGMTFDAPTVPSKGTGAPNTGNKPPQSAQATQSAPAAGAKKKPWEK